MNSGAKPNNIANAIHKTCFVIGLMISVSALFWLMLIAITAPTIELVIPGVVQLAIGVILICLKRFVSNPRIAGVVVACAVSLLVLNSAYAAWFGFASFMGENGNGERLPALSVNDPDSQVVVTVEDSSGPIQSESNWGGTIYADGKRPTQYTGWPVNLVGRKAKPAKLVWHNDSPDWVEIQLDNGFSLKLTWNEELASEARQVTDLHYFLDPKFEIVR